MAWKPFSGILHLVSQHRKAAIGISIAIIAGTLIYQHWNRKRRSGRQSDPASPPYPLPNHWLNCYLNSCLQCLFATRRFQSLLQTKNRSLAHKLYNLSINQSTNTIEEVGREVMPEFGTMQCAHVAFLNIVNALAAEEGQQLLDHYRSMFGVDVKYELKCENGHPINTSENHYLSLSLPIPPIGSKNLDVFECLKVLTQPKKIDFPCDTCGGSNSTHTARIARLSSILVIHFQRYIDGGKDDRAIDFSDDIDFYNFIDTSGKHYEVYGVVYHNGTLHGGHYYAYVKYNGVWYETNDMEVKKVGVEKPPCKGAYMLFCNQIDRP